MARANLAYSGALLAYRARVDFEYSGTSLVRMTRLVLLALRPRTSECRDIKYDQLSGG